MYGLNSLRDLPDGRHPFLYYEFISLKCTCVVSTAFWISQVLGTWQRRCRLQSWSVHHSDELQEPASEESLLFAVVLGLPELVRMITVPSTSSSVNWTRGICAVFWTLSSVIDHLDCVLQLVNLCGPPTWRISMVF